MGSTTAKAEARRDPMKRYCKYTINGQRMCVEQAFRRLKGRLGFYSNPLSFVLLSIRYITLCTEYQPTAARRAVDPRSWNLFQFPSKRSHNNLYMVQILKCLDSNDVEV